MMKQLSLKKIILIGLGILLILFPIVVDNPFVHSLAIKICIFAIYAISYDLLLGYTGIVSFGHALFFGGGAYITFILMKTYNFPFIASLTVVVVVCLIIGLTIGALSIRAKQVYFSMLTLALGQFFYVLVLKLSRITGGDDGLHGLAPLVADKRIFFYITLVLLGLVFIFAKRLINSPTGKVLQAIRENEVRAGMIGYNVINYKLLVIMISGILAGFAGALYVVYLGSAYPLLMHSEMTMKALFMTVLGGMGTLIGPIFGAILIVLAEIYLSQITQRWLLIFGAVYIVMILFFPGGMVSIKQKLTKKKVEVKASCTTETKVEV